MKKYEQLAQHLAVQIEKGVYPVGEKLPSIRHLSRQHNVSISTVQEAFHLLETRGLVEVRAKSGHYVRQTTIPQPPSPPTVPVFGRPWPLMKPPC